MYYWFHLFLFFSVLTQLLVDNPITKNFMINLKSKKKSEDMKAKRSLK